MDDSEQMLINEARAIERQIAKRVAAIEQMEKKLATWRDERIARRPRRYSLEFQFAPVTTNVSAVVDQNFPARESSFTVDGGTEFWCGSVMSSLRIIGTDANSRVADVTLAYDAGGGVGTGAYREGFFSFHWSIRDTGNDREWQNIEMPEAFLLSGHLGPFILPAHAKMKGGSEISIFVRPTFVQDFAGTFGGIFDSISQMILHLSFDGHEVRK